MISLSLLLLLYKVYTVAPIYIYVGSIYRSPIGPNPTLLGGKREDVDDDVDTHIKGSIKNKGSKFCLWAIPFQTKFNNLFFLSSFILLSLFSSSDTKTHYDSFNENKDG